MRELYTSTPKRKAIKEQFAAFLNAIRENRADKYKDFFTKDCETDISVLGKSKGNEATALSMQWNGIEMDYSKITVSNYVCRTKEDFAVVSAYVQFMLIHNGEQTIFPFEFGGIVLLNYQCLQGKWLISKLKFDMAWEKGNTYFAKGWKFLDYQLHKGGQNAIVSELDAPWRVIPVSDEVGTEEEQVAEAFARYAWGVDNTDFAITMSSMEKDVVAVFPQMTIHGIRQMLVFLKNINHKEAALQHAARIVSVQVNEDKKTAKMQMYRIEPHRLGSKVLNATNFKQDFFSARYECDMVKEGTEWKFKTMDYVAKVFMEDTQRTNIFIDEL